MTFNEMNNIKSVLMNYRNSDSCTEIMSKKETDKALISINRQIEAYIFYHCSCESTKNNNPSCSVHGVSAQLERSQME